MSKRRPEPVKFSEDEKTYLAGKYPEFLENKGTRGRKVQQNAQKWVTSTLVPAFLDKFYAQLSQEERSEMSARVDYVSQINPNQIFVVIFTWLSYFPVHLFVLQQ
jgi:hypothetical protein